MNLTGTDIIKFRKARFLAALAEEDLQLIAEEASVCVFDPGQALFREGQTANAFYVVLSGWAILYREHSDGERIVIHLTGPGETFAEALIQKDACYPVSAEAASRLRVAKLETGKFRKLILSSPELALEIVSATFTQLRALVDRVERDNGWSAQRRVASFLLSFCGSSSACCSFALPVEQQLVAARLSMSPATLSRTLTGLSAIGVTATRGRIVVNDVAALKRLADNDKN